MAEMLQFAALTEAKEATYVPPGRVIQAPTNQMDPTLLLARAHRLGMKVQFWTINEAAEMKSLIALGADGIFTDDPALLAGIVAQK